MAWRSSDSQLDLGALLHWRSLAENISANCPCKELRKPGRPSNNLQLDNRRMFCCAHTSTLEMQCSKLKTCGVQKLIQSLAFSYYLSVLYVTLREVEFGIDSVFPSLKVTRLPWLLALALLHVLADVHKLFLRVKVFLLVFVCLFHCWFSVCVFVFLKFSHCLLFSWAYFTSLFRHLRLSSPTRAMGVLPTTGTEMSNYLNYCGKHFVCSKQTCFLMENHLVGFHALKPLPFPSKTGYALDLLPFRAPWQGNSSVFRRYGLECKARL